MDGDDDILAAAMWAGAFVAMMLLAAVKMS